MRDVRGMPVMEQMLMKSVRVTAGVRTGVRSELKVLIQRFTHLEFKNKKTNGKDEVSSIVMMKNCW